VRPACTLLCEDESVIGRAFYVMEFVEGRVLWDQALPGMTPAERGAIYDEMNRVIAALHGVDPPGRGPGGAIGKPGNYFERQIDALEPAVPQASVTEPIPEMDRLIAWLPAAHPGRRTRPSQCPSCTATSASTT
jgi:aminoglycoside phosphotransferase (APT) family kinase protein